jgi:hypothetical protein
MDATPLKRDRLNSLPHSADSHADRDDRLPSLAAYTADNSVAPQDERAAKQTIFYELGLLPGTFADMEPYSGLDPDTAAERRKNLCDLLSKAAPGDLRSLAAEITDLRTDLVALGPDGQLFAIQAKRRTRDGFPQRRYNAWAAAEDAVQTAFMDILAAWAVRLDDHRRALPAYAVRPYLVQQCCLATPPFSTAMDVGGGSKSSAVTQELVWAHALASATMRFTVTFSDRQLFQDYKNGLLRLVDTLLASLLRMLVVLLAALAHQAIAPAFLLVMLRSIRHYGHRGEPDHLALPALAPTFDRRRGAVRLVA